jgi:hypothetical protein
MTRGHVVSLRDGSVRHFLGETSEQDAGQFARKHFSEDPIIKPLGGAEAYDVATRDRLARAVPFAQVLEEP